MSITWIALRARLQSYFKGAAIGRALFLLDPAASTVRAECWDGKGGSLGVYSGTLSAWLVNMLSSGFKKQCRPDRIDAAKVDANFTDKRATVTIYYLKEGEPLSHTEEHRWT